VENETTTSGSATVGARAMVVGLGNPGAAYEATRHNFGFWVIDRLRRRLGAGDWREECAAHVARTETADLVKPQTFMNRSGHAVRCLIERYGYEPVRVLVVYDEVALPLGTLRMRPAGGPGGHRGLASVLESLRTDRVPRLRLGIASVTADASVDLADFVLRGFDPAERAAVERQAERAAEACEAWLERGVEAAMSAFNGPLPEPPGSERAPVGPNGDGDGAQRPG
jgi:PTH1 family peptidyl-tRNA hydrolase